VPIGEVTVSPSALSWSRALRTVVSATLCSWASVVIEGTGAPGCSSPPPPTPYQQFVASLAKVGLQPKQKQAGETAWAKHICNNLANMAEDNPDSTDVIYPAAVTDIVKQGHTEAQASAVVRAVIEDFCPQWKVLLRQQG
jgi:Protein of unknown function (DUF732)